MNALTALVALVRRVPNAPRWPYAIPAFVAFRFIGHAIEDAGAGAGAVLGVFIAFCALQAVWPTILGWIILFGPFLGYGLLVAFSRDSAPVEEWVVFMGLGLVPALLLWLGRPWKRSGLNTLSEETR